MVRFFSKIVILVCIISSSYAMQEQFKNFLKDAAKNISNPNSPYVVYFSQNLSHLLESQDRFLGKERRFDDDLKNEILTAIGRLPEVCDSLKNGSPRFYNLLLMHEFYADKRDLRRCFGISWEEKDQNYFISLSKSREQTETISLQEFQQLMQEGLSQN